MKKGILHLRVSSTRQADEGESLEVQEAIGKKYARDNNIELVEVFRESYSGRKDERPVLEQIFRFLEANPGIEIYIIRNIRRFTRGGSGPYQQLKKNLKQRGVDLVDTAGTIQPVCNTLDDVGFEYDWSMASPSRTSEAVAAEEGSQEVTRILTRMIGQEIRNARQGYSVRPAVIGYQNKKIECADGKTRTILERAPFEAPWVELAFALRAEGVLSDEAICVHVNSIGFRTRIQKKRDPVTRKQIGTTGGKQMTPKMLQRMVCRPAYCGVAIEKWTNWQPVRCPYPGLVPIETFNAANRGKVEILERSNGELAVAYDAKRKGRRRDNPEYPFRFVVLCSKCRSPFKGSASRGKSGKHYPAYHCSKGHSYCRIPKKQFHGAIARFVKELSFYNEDFLSLFETVAMDVWRKKQKEALKVSRKSGESVVALQKQQEHLLAQFTQAESSVVKKMLEKKIEDLETEIAVSSKTRNENEITEANIRAYIRRFKFLMEHPQELLLSEENQRVLGQVWSFAFEKLPTYEEIVGGTPEMTVILDLSRQPKPDKNTMVARLSSKWNVFVKQVRHGCRIPIEVFRRSSRLANVVVCNSGDCID